MQSAWIKFLVLNQGSMSSNFVAIGKLMSDSPSAKSLRGIIIDKEPVKFLPGLGKYLIG